MARWVFAIAALIVAALVGWHQYQSRPMTEDRCFQVASQQGAQLAAKAIGDACSKLFLPANEFTTAQRKLTPRQREYLMCIVENVDGAKTDMGARAAAAPCGRSPAF